MSIRLGGLLAGIKRAVIDAHRNGVVSIKQRAIHVPLIALPPLRSHVIDRV